MGRTHPRPTHSLCRTEYYALFINQECQTDIQSRDFLVIEMAHLSSNSLVRVRGFRVVTSEF